MNETEKITINLGIVELAQIDVLVEQGIYSNRSDFIRTTIRKQLEVHEEKIERAVASYIGADQKSDIWAVGIAVISERDLNEAFRANNGKIKISVIGMLKITDDVSTVLFQNTVARISIKGKLVASAEIKKLIGEMQ